MGEHSSIAWTTHTFNPWIGCTKVSPGCSHCYAQVETYARVQRSRGIELWGIDAARHVTSDANWRKPLAWNEAARSSGRRARVFCASLADVFEDRPDLVAPRSRLAQLVDETPWLDWMLLTKRPEHAARLWAACVCPCGGDHARVWPGNVWLGTTVENQATRPRIYDLLAVPAQLHFVSVEPQLEEVDLGPWLGAIGGLPGHCVSPDGAHWWHEPGRCEGGPVGCNGRCCRAGIDWVIQGGESGSKARPFDLAWARSMRDQCRRAGVPYFFKQAGAMGEASRVGLALHDAKGGDLAELPEDLRIREFPTMRRVLGDRETTVRLPDRLIAAAFRESVAKVVGGRGQEELLLEVYKQRGHRE